MKSVVLLAIAAAAFQISARVVDVSPSAAALSTPVTRYAPNTRREPDSLTSRPKIAFWDDDFASEAEWNVYTGKGGALMCGIQGSDQTAGRQMKDGRNPPSAASPFSGDLKAEMHDWYWRSVNPSSYGCSFSDHWDFAHAMQSLSLSGKSTAQGGDNQCYRVEHWDPERRDDAGNQIPAINQLYTVPGIEKQYRATKAHYEFGINTKGGAIYGLFLESPQSSAKTLWGNGKKEPSKDDLPSLRAFSDILWGYWNRENPDVKKIRYFFMVGISNEETNRLIASCLSHAKRELSPWPGTEFASTTDEGHALLGSPNGAAFAYFLMQHKAELGHKTISSITVFMPDKDEDVSFVDPSLCFHVQDGPPQQPPPDEAASSNSNNDQQRTHVVSKRLDGDKAGGQDVVRIHEIYT